MSNIFRNHIWFKVTLPALMVLLLFGIPAGFGVRFAQVTGETNEQVATHNLELLEIGGLANAVRDEQMLAHEVAHTSGSRALALEKMASAVSGQEQLIRNAKEGVFASEEEEELVSLEELVHLHRDATDRFLSEAGQAMEQGGMARLEAEADAFKASSEKMLVLLGRMSEICTEERDEATAVRDAALNRLGTAAFASFIAALLLMLGVAALVSRWIAKPLRQMVRAARAMSRGELGQRVETAARDEIGQLAGAFNAMADSLERRTGELEELNDKALAKNRIVTSLTAGLELDEVYDNFYIEMKKLIDFDCISITEPAGEGWLRVVASRGQRPQECVEGFTFEAAGKPMSAVMDARAPFLSGDIAADARIGDKKWFAKAEFQSIINLPLIVKGRVLGTLNMASRSRDAFGDADVEKLQPVADQVALALDNQKLFRDVAKAKNEWEATFDSVGDGIVMVNNDHVVLRINRAAAALLGGSVGEFVARSCRDICPGFDDMMTECRNQAAVAEHESVTAEYRTDAGRILEVMSDNIFDAEGTQSGAVYILRDVTEARRLRRQLVQSEKMVAVGELVSGVAHEINNPLTGVLGYAQLLASRDIDKQARKDAECIQQEAERATRIVRQLLSFARKHEPERAMTDVNAVVRELLDLKAYDLKVNNVRVEADLDGSLPATLTDRHQLQQVFLNMITNAEQAMLVNEKSGLLKVKTGRTDGHIQVVFADDGHGIPEAIRNRIFDPFFTTKEVGKGTGLGLSVCYGVVEDHGGRILVDDTPGGGATFVVEFPIIAADSKPEPVPQTGGGLTEEVPQGKILLVDDEAGIRQALTKILQQAGHDVETAEDGETALAMLKREHYDCVVSDVKMPRMDGPTLHREAQSLDPGLAGNFIFISGDTMNHETRSYLDMVENPHLIKPFSAGDLENVLKEVMNGR